MPKINEVRELRKGKKYIWLTCQVCKNERWFSLSKSGRCYRCGSKDEETVRRSPKLLEVLNIKVSGEAI